MCATLNGGTTSGSLLHFGNIRSIHYFNRTVYGPRFDAAHHFISNFVGWLLFAGEQFTWRGASGFVFVTQVASSSTWAIGIEIVARFASSIFRSVIAAVTATRLGFNSTEERVRFIINRRGFIQVGTRGANRHHGNFTTRVRGYDQSWRTSVFTSGNSSQDVAGRFDLFTRQDTRALYRWIGRPNADVVSHYNMFDAKIHRTSGRFGHRIFLS